MMFNCLLNDVHWLFYCPRILILCFFVRVYCFRPNGAEVGDLLVLTKPLGTQIAVNAHQWIELPEHWKRISSVISQAEVVKAYNRAMSSMSRLNRNGITTLPSFLHCLMDSGI